MGQISLHDNQTGELLKTISLTESWDLVSVICTYMHLHIHSADCLTLLGLGLIWKTRSEPFMLIEAGLYRLDGLFLRPNWRWCRFYVVHSIEGTQSMVVIQVSRKQPLDYILCWSTKMTSQESGDLWLVMWSNWECLYIKILILHTTNDVVMQVSNYGIKYDFVYVSVEEFLPYLTSFKHSEIALLSTNCEPRKTVGTFSNCVHFRGKVNCNLLWLSNFSFFTCRWRRPMDIVGIFRQMLRGSVAF